MTQGTEVCIGFWNSTSDYWCQNENGVRHLPSARINQYVFLWKWMRSDSSFACLDIPIIDLVANPDIHRTSTIAPEGSIFVVCRLGNDSKHGVDIFKAMFPDRHVSDLVGGLQAWSKHVDPQFPVYWLRIYTPFISHHMLFTSSWTTLAPSCLPELNSLLSNSLPELQFHWQQQVEELGDLLLAPKQSEEVVLQHSILRSN